jgi:UDPglucose 6-dehydrogenase
MGLATGLAFAQSGVPTVGFDIDPRRSSAIAKGRAPIYEPGLEPLLRKNLAAGRFQLASTVDELARRASVIFLCLPTPSLPSGRINLGPIRQGCRELGRALRGVPSHRTVVVKSTVVPGTTDGVIRPLLERASRRGADRLSVAANPEFLAEGSMVEDALHPQRIVLGVSDNAGRTSLESAYKNFTAPRYTLAPAGAELVKYASNSFLALKVSFANEIAQLTVPLGVDVDPIMEAVGSDGRIGRRFLSAGPGFGGSCFDKDLRALAARASDLGVRGTAMRAALTINRLQAEHCVDLVRRATAMRPDARVAILGLSFKEGTDDVRQSRALPIAQRLLQLGLEVRLHDPKALSNFRQLWLESGSKKGRQPMICATPANALRGADLAVLQVAWPEYLAWPARWTREMRTPTILDLRRALPPRARRAAGVRYLALGDGSTWAPEGPPAPASRRAAKAGRVER